MGDGTDEWRDLMPKIAYIDKKFRGASLDVIAVANDILEDYAAQGFKLTVRQLYYQFVARGHIANRPSEYNRLGSIINDARLAGYIDWDYIEDRTRNLEKVTHWNSPAHIIEAAAKSYRRSLWDTQPRYVEVWIEKDALVGVIENACEELDVPYLSCRGYTSQSEMWAAGQRFTKRLAEGKDVTIIHLGDHDPSGKDMTRDIEDRLDTFSIHDRVKLAINQAYDEGHEEFDEGSDGRMRIDELYKAMGNIAVNRIALNWDQIEEYNPPPNFAKVTDSRATAYINEFGTESWELDALEPTVIDELIRDTIMTYVDTDAWQEALKREQKEVQRLQLVHERWPEIERSLDGDHVDE